MPSESATAGVFPGCVGLPPQRRIDGATIPAAGHGARIRREGGDAVSVSRLDLHGGAVTRFDVTTAPAAPRSGANPGGTAACGMTCVDSSRHEGGADILASPEDLYVALGVRLRERPGARWMVEMHPQTRAEFDVDAFNDRFGRNDVRIYASSYIAPGQYQLSQRGFGSGNDTGPDEADRWPRSSG